MKYELKKFICKSNVVVILLIILVMSFVSPLLSIRNYYSLSKVADEIVEIKGLEGIKNEKKKYKTISGPLHTEKLNRALDIYKETNKDNSYINTDLEYPNILPLLITSFSPIREYDIKYLDNKSDVNGFYKERINKINNFLELDYKTKMFEDWEKDEIIKKAESINIPFNYNYFGQWNLLFQNLQFVLIMIICSTVIISSQLYSYENEKNMGIVLNTSGKKSLIKVGKNKIQAISTLIILQYILCFTIVSAIFFIAFGVEGNNSEIQISRRFFMSIYNLTFGKVYILYFLLGLGSILSIMGIVSTINSYIQKSYLSLIIGTIIIIVPYILCTTTSLPLIMRKFFSIQPINGIYIEKILISQQIYNILNFKMLGLSATMIMSIILYLISIFLAPKLFINKIREK